MRLNGKTTSWAHLEQVLNKIMSVLEAFPKQASPRRQEVGQMRALQIEKESREDVDRICMNVVWYGRLDEPKLSSLKLAEVRVAEAIAFTRFAQAREAEGSRPDFKLGEIESEADGDILIYLLLDYWRFGGVHRWAASLVRSASGDDNLMSN